MRRVLIVEDAPETRRWLAKTVSQTFAGAIITEVATLRAAFLNLREEVDLALIDLCLPDGSGLELLRALRAQRCSTLCVVTTVLADDATVVAALSAGADGYLLKEQTAETLSRHLQQLSEGVPPLSPSIARRIMEHFRLTGPSGPAEAELTPREAEVLGLIGRGMRNGEVAALLDLSEHTVAGYIKTIYRKLGVSSRAEASWQAARLGLLRRPDAPS